MCKIGNVPLEDGWDVPDLERKNSGYYRHGAFVNVDSEGRRYGFATQIGLDHPYCPFAWATRT
jgi:hypothetical protein